MAQITITVADAKVQRVIDALKATYGYTGKAPDGSPETEQQFLRRLIKDWLREVTRAHEIEAARRAAAAQADTIGEL